MVLNDYFLKEFVVFYVIRICDFSVCYCFRDFGELRSRRGFSFCGVFNLVMDNLIVIKNKIVLVFYKYFEGGKWYYMIMIVWG